MNTALEAQIISDRRKRYLINGKQIFKYAAQIRRQRNYGRGLVLKLCRIGASQALDTYGNVLGKTVHFFFAVLSRLNSIMIII